MKAIQKSWLLLTFLSVVIVLLPACEGKNASNYDPYDDAEGVITVKIKNDGYTWVGCDDASFFCIGADNNFYVNNLNTVDNAIADVGVKKFSQITSLPSVGWANNVAVIVGHSYVYRFEAGDYGYRERHFLKIYVKDWLYSTSGGIVGAEVQYCEWSPKE